MQDRKDELAIVVTATRDQINEFKGSLLWRDIKHELEVWKSAARNEYSQVIGDIISGESGIENSDMHLGSLYGREATIDYLLSIPDIFLEILEDKKDESRRK